jgi:hypothetical protein
MGIKLIGISRLIGEGIAKSKNLKKLSSIILVVLICVSCQNEELWYPSADVFVNNYYEYNIATGRALSVTLVVYNTGKTSIISSTITIKATTDKHVYLQTIGSEAKIIPGGRIAINVVIPYFEDERVLDNGISIYGAYFD